MNGKAMKRKMNYHKLNLINQNIILHNLPPIE